MGWRNLPHEGWADPRRENHDRWSFCQQRLLDVVRSFGPAGATPRQIQLRVRRLHAGAPRQRDTHTPRPKGGGQWPSTAR